MAGGRKGARTPSPETNPPWITIEGIVLREEDRKVLESNSQWFTDSLINCCQFMLKREYPNIGGLQNVCLMHTRPISLEPVKTRFVQVMLESENHWFTISNLTHEDPCEISVYDSKSDSKSDVTFRETLEYVFDMMPEETKLRFIVEQVTQQVDNSQCGPMAIAFAKALCSGVNPADIQFSDDPRTLREHIVNCINDRRISNFPTGSRTPIATYELKKKLSKRNIVHRKLSPREDSQPDVISSEQAD